MDDYEIILIAEYDDDKQRMTADEARAACKKIGAEIIDANHFCNPEVKIPSKYLPCFYSDSNGSLWRGFNFDYFGYRRSLGVGYGLDCRGGVIGMRRKAPHTHMFVKQKERCECGVEKV